MAYTGIACFAGLNENFPTKRVLNAYPRNIKTPGTAILYDFFGDTWTFPTSFCNKFADRPHCIQWHLCFRNPLPIKELRKRTKKIIKKMNEIGNENTKIIICPVLEDNCSDKKFKIIVNGLKKAANGVKIVRNPCMGGKVVGPYDYEEHHGGNPSYRKLIKKRIYNPDGMSVDFRDGDKYFNRMSISHFESLVDNEMFMWLIWYSGLQGFRNCKDFTDKPPLNERKYVFPRKALRGSRKILQRN